MCIAVWPIYKYDSSFSDTELAESRADMMTKLIEKQFCSDAVRTSMVSGVDVEYPPGSNRWQKVFPRKEASTLDHPEEAANAKTLQTGCATCRAEAGELCAFGGMKLKMRCTKSEQALYDKVQSARAALSNAAAGEKRAAGRLVSSGVRVLKRIRLQERTNPWWSVPGNPYDGAFAFLHN
eukprot:5594853-Prymnesium_polylepis.1